MKTIPKIALTAVGLILTQEANAQGTVYLSNLSKSTAYSAPVAADSWQAQFFFTGGISDGYHLDSVQLLMSSPAGNPNDFSLWIYAGTVTAGPQTPVANLAGATPGSAGVFTYTAANVVLAPASEYWLVATCASPTIAGSYSWNVANTGSYDGPWRTAVSYSTSNDGLVWTVNGDAPLQFAINATAIPEPSSVALLSLGGFFFAMRRLRRFSRVKT